MRILWLTNVVPGAVQKHLGGNASGGLWVDRVLTGLMTRENTTLRVLSRDVSEASGTVSPNLSFRLFTEELPERYEPALEKLFREELRTFQPDVIHIWGTEYGHTLAMVMAAGVEKRIGNTVVSIQGLCSEIARHYADGLSNSVTYGFSLRDLLRQDNVALQRRKFVHRGELEIEALKQARHVIGRTPWDYACTEKINPRRQYHFCNETLREPFYTDSWDYKACTKHRIFASSCAYPVKGFHYLLEAFAEVQKVYPDATISVTGRSVFQTGLRSSGYEQYLAKQIRRMGAKEKVLFRGDLNAEQMKQEYLQANVFVMPSTIENSPNSLGEAMLLGVPCVAAEVGGTAALIRGGEEGILYRDPHTLAQHILDVFAVEEKAGEMGSRAAVHARQTHDAEENLRTLTEIYAAVSEE